MARYIVTRERTYWVKETQVVEANSEEEAEERFLDEFDPVLEIRDLHRFGCGEFSTPITVAESASGGVPNA